MSMDQYKKRIEQIVINLIKDGVNPQEISWMFNSIIIKRTDIYYRLDQELNTSRVNDITDNPTGDSEVCDATKDDLDRALNMYMSHDLKCDCYTRDDLCPICLEGCLEHKLDCCNQYIHHSCLAESYQKGRTTCPLCRHKLRLEKIVDSLKVVADIKPVTRDPPKRNFSMDDYAANNFRMIDNRSSIDPFNREQVNSYLNNNVIVQLPQVQDSEEIINTEITNATRGYCPVQLPQPPSILPYSEEIINAAPIVGYCDIFVTLDDGYVIKVHPDESMVVIGINRGLCPDRNMENMELLTDSEKTHALNLGLSVLESSSLLHTMMH